MVQTELLNEKYCQIHMDESNGILYAKWNGFLFIDQIKKGCEMMSEYIQQNGIKVHLSNHQDLKVLSDECKDYLTQEWFPAVEKIGLQKIAAIVSPNIFTRSSIEEVNESTVKLGGLTIETFNSQTEGEGWLLS